MANGKAFEGAEYYDCDDSVESLSRATPAEALEYYFDSLHKEGVSIEDDIAAYSPVTVYAWHRMEPDLTIFAGGLVDTLAERIREDDELGMCDVDGYDPVKWDAGAIEKAIADAIAPFGKSVVPWCCEQTGNREYSAEEATAILREQCPTWFKEATNGKR
jgi:hypothetical protein